MPDEKSPYQEKVEESDLNTEGKFGITQEHEKEKKAPIAEQERPVEVSASEKDSSYNKILSKVQSDDDSVSDQSAIEMDAQGFSEKQDAESQIQHLVDIADQKGVVHSVKVAKHLEDNYVLDMFHDKLLSDELHDALIKKGLIKEI